MDKSDMYSFISPKLTVRFGLDYPRGVISMKVDEMDGELYGRSSDFKGTHGIEIRSESCPQLVVENRGIFVYLRGTDFRLDNSVVEYGFQTREKMHLAIFRILESLRKHVGAKRKNRRHSGLGLMPEQGEPTLTVGPAPPTRVRLRETFMPYRPPTDCRIDCRYCVNWNRNGEECHFHPAPF